MEKYPVNVQTKTLDFLHPRLTECEKKLLTGIRLRSELKGNMSIENNQFHHGKHVHHYIIWNKYQEHLISTERP